MASSGDWKTLVSCEQNIFLYKWNSYTESNAGSIICLLLCNLIISIYSFTSRTVSADSCCELSKALRIKNFNIYVIYVQSFSNLVLSGSFYNNSLTSLNETP